MSLYIKETIHQIKEFYKKSKYAYSEEHLYNDNLTDEDINKMWSYRKSRKFDCISDAEKKAIDDINLCNLLEKFEKAGIITINKDKSDNLQKLGKAKQKINMAT